MSPCFPFGKDYQLVSVNRFHDHILRNIAGSCLDLDSEFFFMSSPTTGCVGNLPRENFFRYQPDGALNLGFLMILGYSEKIERAVIAALTLSKELTEEKSGLSAGITSCAIWSRGIFEGNTKVIAIAGDDPLFDGSKFLYVFARLLIDVKKYFGTPGQSYYAEKFGYERFFMRWENYSPYDMAASSTIAEFELDTTKEIVGGSSREDFPPFMGAAVSIQ